MSRVPPTIDSGDRDSGRLRIRDWMTMMLGVIALLFTLRSCGFFPDGASSNGTPSVTGAPGPAGADGRDGDAGTAGQPGSAGADGRDGDAGRPGADGRDGEIGPPGSPGEDAVGIGFGQGRIGVGSCDDSVGIRLRSFWNAAEHGFFLDSIVLSDLADRCAGLDLHLVLLDAASDEIISMTASVQVLDGTMTVTRRTPAFQALATVESLSVAGVALEIS